MSQNSNDTMNAFVFKATTEPAIADINKSLNGLTLRLQLEEARAQGMRSQFAKDREALPKNLTAPEPKLAEHIRCIKAMEDTIAITKDHISFMKDYLKAFEKGICDRKNDRPRLADYVKADAILYNSTNHEFNSKWFMTWKQVDPQAAESINDMLVKNAKNTDPALAARIADWDKDRTNSSSQDKNW